MSREVNESSGDFPREIDLYNRIVGQLERSGGDSVALLWKGYLAGLFEWGLIDFDVYSRLVDVIPAVGDKDLAELFADDSISSEELQEIERRGADRK